MLVLNFININIYFNLYKYFNGLFYSYIIFFDLVYIDVLKKKKENFLNLCGCVYYV